MFVDVTPILCFDLLSLSPGITVSGRTRRQCNISMIACQVALALALSSRKDGTARARKVSIGLEAERIRVWHIRWMLATAIVRIFDRRWPHRSKHRSGPRRE
jgi:hypothetical protein